MQFRLCKWRLYIYESYIRGTWRGAPILGILKDMKKVLEKGHSLHRA